MTAVVQHKPKDSSMKFPKNVQNVNDISNVTVSECARYIIKNVESIRKDAIPVAILRTMLAIGTHEIIDTVCDTTIVRACDIRFNLVFTPNKNGIPVDSVDLNYRILVSYVHDVGYSWQADINNMNISKFTGFRSWLKRLPIHGDVWQFAI